MRPPTQFPRRRSAFTLLELLVVVAIIMLLAGLLLPALKQARDRARTAQCQSGLRQVTTALFLYADDYDGVLPAYSDGASPPMLWQQFLGPHYLNEPQVGYNNLATIQRSVLHCPADLSVYASTGKPTRCIAINGTMTGSVTNAPGIYGRVYPQSIGATMCRIAAVRYPSDMCLCGDGASAWWTSEWGSGARYFDIGNVASTPWAAFIRHTGGMNFGFIDGHIQLLPEATIQQVLATQGVCGKMFDWCGSNQ